VASAADNLVSAIGPDGSKEMNWWAQAVARQSRLWLQDLNQLAPWRGADDHGRPVQIDASRDEAWQAREAPTLTEVARIEETLLRAIDTSTGVGESNERFIALRATVVAASESAAKRISELRRLAVRCRELADIDFRFLYDKDRYLLSIGFDIAQHRLDSGFYDLLASEARLASFVGIAHAKLPVEHWFHLGRSLTNTNGGMALLSWSGSMFEYLMPLLIMPNYEHTLLDATYRAVVKRQIEYGGERGVPWGNSESGYAKTDAQGNYQYQAFVNFCA
jgi:hypothetical protein